MALSRMKALSESTVYLMRPLNGHDVQDLDYFFIFINFVESGVGYGDAADRFLYGPCAESFPCRPARETDRPQVICIFLLRSSGFFGAMS